jgi:hypothetical protein
MTNNHPALRELHDRVRKAEARAADCYATNTNLIAMLEQLGECNARLSREMSEAHAEIRMWRTAADERADALDAMQALLDELEQE